MYEITHCDQKWYTRALARVYPLGLTRILTNMLTKNRIFRQISRSAWHFWGDGSTGVVREATYIFSFYLRCRNWPYFRSTDSSLRDTGWFSTLPHLGMKFAHWQKIQKLHIYSLSTAEASKLSPFSLYGQWFSRYSPIFKIAIFEHKTWPVAKVPEVL